MGSLDARRVQLVLFSTIGAAALLAVVLLGTGSLGAGGVRLSAAERARLAAGRPSVGGALLRLPHARPTASRHSESARRAPGRHVRPDPDSRDLRERAADLSPRAGRTLPDPSGPGDVAYYDMSKFPGLGGVPGDGHNAILAGHVDLNRDIPYAGAHYQGPGVFWNLDRLRPGDVVEIDFRGKTLRYTVTSAREYPADGTDWQKIWSGDVKRETVTLFTCGGTSTQRRTSTARGWWCAPSDRRRARRVGWPCGRYAIACCAARYPNVIASLAANPPPGTHHRRPTACRCRRHTARRSAGDRRRAPARLGS